MVNADAPLEELSQLEHLGQDPVRLLQLRLDGRIDEVVNLGLLAGRRQIQAAKKQKAGNGEKHPSVRK